MPWSQPSSSHPILLTRFSVGLVSLQSTIKIIDSVVHNTALPRIIIDCLLVISSMNQGFHLPLCGYNSPIRVGEMIVPEGPMQSEASRKERCLYANVYRFPLVYIIRY